MFAVCTLAKGRSGWVQIRASQPLGFCLAHHDLDRPLWILRTFGEAEPKGHRTPVCSLGSSDRCARVASNVLTEAENFIRIAKEHPETPWRQVGLQGRLQSNGPNGPPDCGLGTPRRPTGPKNSLTGPNWPLIVSSRKQAVSAPMAHQVTWHDIGPGCPYRDAGPV